MKIPGCFKLVARSLLVSATLVGFFLPAANGQTYTPGAGAGAEFNAIAKAFLADHCVDCHGATDPEGNLSLVDLGPVDETNAATWKSVWAQVSLNEMPPADMPQPEVVERLRFSDGIVDALTRAMRDQGGFLAPFDPDKGNFVDHDFAVWAAPCGD